MTYPKMKPCPKCQSSNVACYTYESGWSRVECDACTHISSCEGRKLDAIRVHNKLALETAAVRPRSDRGSAEA